MQSVGVDGVDFHQIIFYALRPGGYKKLNKVCRWNWDHMKRPRLLRVPCKQRHTCKHGPGARHVVDGAQDSGSAARSSAADVMATSELGGPGNPTLGGWVSG